MLVPQFTTRRLLAIVTACSLLFLVLSLAVRGQAWATATSIGLGAAVLTLLTFAFFFQIAFLLAKLVGAVRPKERPKSPFAQDTPPPRYARPEAVE